MSSYDPQLDLTGKLIIKVQLGEDIRRIPIHNEDITYDELLLMMQRVYRSKLNSTDDITIKYKDEDGDLITIFDSTDLSYAIQCSRILKITLFVNGLPRPLEHDEIKMIKGELRNVRDTVNRLLDRLEPKGVSSTTDNSPVTDITSAIVNNGLDSPRPHLSLSNAQKQTNVANSKEFDPLSIQRSVEDATQSKVMSSFGISNDASAAGDVQDRSATPDSISSAGSSYRQQQLQQQQILQQQQLQQQHPSQTGLAPQQTQPGAPPQPNPTYQHQTPPQAQPAQQQQSQAAQPNPGYGAPGQPGYQPAGYQYSQQAPAQGGAQQAAGYTPAGQPASSQPYPASSSQAGFSAPATASQPGYGYNNQTQGQTTQQQNPAFQQGFAAQGQQQFPAGYSQAAAPGQAAGPGGANPYSRGPGQGGYTAYPRPQGQYPPGYR